MAKQSSRAPLTADLIAQLQDAANAAQMGYLESRDVARALRKYASDSFSPDDKRTRQVERYEGAARAYLAHRINALCAMAGAPTDDTSPEEAQND